jgi:hypothetical protein
MTVVARVLVLALAVLGAGVAFSVHRGDTRCADVVARAQHLSRATPAATTAQLARDALDRCPNATRAVTVSLLLSGAGRRADGLRVARGLVRREPGDYLGWYVLSGMERDRPVAQAALARARALNPTVGRP